MSKTLEETEDEIVACSERVLQRLTAEFQALKSSQSSLASSFAFGFANSQGRLGPDGGPHPAAPVKYLIHARGHVKKFYPFLPYLSGPKRVFEIGVGPGHLFKILRDCFDVDVYGCDIEFDKTIVYREIRRELGIADRVLEYAVRAYSEIPIPTDCEGLFAFWTAFNTSWGVNEHHWFLDFCKERLVGPKLVALRFNRAGFTDKPEVIDFYEKNAVVPIGRLLRDPAVPQQHVDNFCVISLAN
jgi:hypothetical protein